jgi:hypothetical protein
MNWVVVLFAPLRPVPLLVSPSCRSLPAVRVCGPSLRPRPMLAHRFRPSAPGLVRQLAVGPVRPAAPRLVVLGQPTLEVVGALREHEVLAVGPERSERAAYSVIERLEP